MALCRAHGDKRGTGRGSPCRPDGAVALFAQYIPMARERTLWSEYVILTAMKAAGETMGPDGQGASTFPILILGRPSQPKKLQGVRIVGSLTDEILAEIGRYKAVVFLPDAHWPEWMETAASGQREPVTPRASADLWAESDRRQAKASIIPLLRHASTGNVVWVMVPTDVHQWEAPASVLMESFAVGFRVGRRETPVSSPLFDTKGTNGADNTATLTRIIERLAREQIDWPMSFSLDAEWDGAPVPWANLIQEYQPYIDGNSSMPVFLSVSDLGRAELAPVPRSAAGGRLAIGFACGSGGVLITHQAAPLSRCIEVLRDSLLQKHNETVPPLPPPAASRRMVFLEERDAIRGHGMGYCVQLGDDCCACLSQETYRLLLVFAVDAVTGGEGINTERPKLKCCEIPEGFFKPYRASKQKPAQQINVSFRKSNSAVTVVEAAPFQRVTRYRLSKTIEVDRPSLKKALSASKFRTAGLAAYL